ncbi:MAG: lipoyl(octanoyl) transferase LipB [Betaproteobacteria bacterium]|nr:lipoyl(octanoyl) transferase LipB [Betaproteobacteria bacterium]
MIIRDLGRTDFDSSYEAMRRFTAARDMATPDELWLTEHPPVYTVGAAGRPQHLPGTGADQRIQVKRVDRGGQITYHGPGQAIVYTLLDLPRGGLKIRALVQLLEQAVIDLLGSHQILASRRSTAPGVYVDGAKIAALGLRVTRRGCYHGVALNVDMDLTPFYCIDPCGYPGLAVTQTRALGIDARSEEIGGALANRIAALLEPVHG